MGPREKDIERAACRLAADLGWRTRKFSSPGRAGVLDRMFFRRGPDGRPVVVWIEFKARGGRLSALQELEIGELLAAGFPVFVCYSVREAEEALRRHA